jgi:hypothetical protein
LAGDPLETARLGGEMCGRTIEHERRTGDHWVLGIPSPGLRCIESYKEKGMGNENMHRGGCFCGAVKFELTGQPEAMGYCHCGSCRHWSAGPVNAFTLWKPASLKVTKGADIIGTYNKTPISFRKWCTQCGGHLFTDHPTFGLVDVYAAMLPTLPFDAGVHVHYQESVLPMRDGKPKFKDMPTEMGGSGAMLPE